jgi:hypothetical protein
MAIAIGNGQFGIEAAGTDQHQDELELMAGGRTETGVDHLCGALLVPNPKNPYDPNAIAVVINSEVVGYIPSNIAPSLKYALRVGGYIAAGCAAKIVGGWARADGDIGDFSVRLDADWPFKLRPIAKQETPPAPPPVFSPPSRPAPPPPVAVPAPATPRVEVRPFADDEGMHQVIEEPRRRRSLLAIVVELILIVAILAGGVWWVQRLPREPQNVTAPAAPAPEPASPPAEPAPQSQPFQWPDPPPQFQAPPAAPPPDAAPAPAPPAAAPPPAAKKPAPKKPAAPKTPPPNAPLKIN